MINLKHVGELKLDIFFISFIATVIFSYLVGSTNSSIILSKLYKLPDPRGYGSKNPGATNILRSGNKVIALSVLVFDILKGCLPVLIAYYLLEDKLYAHSIGYLQDSLRIIVQGR